MRLTSVRQRYLIFTKMFTDADNSSSVFYMKTLQCFRRMILKDEKCEITVLDPQTASISTMDVIKRVVQLLSGGQSNFSKQENWI